MTKKKASSSVEPEKKSPVTKKPCSEIEEIFSKRRRKKPGQEKIQNSTKDDTLKPEKMKKKSKSKESRFADPPPRPRKKTGDGLALYSEEELGIGKADAGDFDAMMTSLQLRRSTIGSTVGSSVQST